MSASPERTSIFAPFAHAHYRNIWAANLVSNFGGIIQATGAAWLMTSLTEDKNMVALVQASTAAPVMIFALASGAVADNFNRRRILLIAQSFMLLVSVGLSLLSYFGTLTPWQLLSFTFLIGCGMALNVPSWQASVGDLVKRGDLPSAVLLNSVSFNISRSTAPALGGVIIAIGGAASAFALNAASYIGMIFALFRWRPEYPPNHLPREKIGRAMAAGLRYVVMSPNIAKVLLRGCLFGVGVSAVLALLPLVARERLQGGPVDYGFLLGAFGLGGVFGALTSARLRSIFTSETFLRGVFVISAVMACVIGLSTNRWLSSGALVFAGASSVWTFSLLNVTVQLSAPRWVLARALALYLTAVQGGLAFGSWLWGEVAQHHGLQAALLIAGGEIVFTALIGLYLPLPELKSLNLTPLNQWSVPKLALRLKPSSGPIVIMVEYLIRDEDVPEFLSAMEERRRIRLRDGAHDWTLMRNVQHPERWTMTYKLPTWVEYARHMQRSTQADAGVGDRIRALHQGPQDPFIHRMIERQTNWIPEESEVKTASETGMI